MTNNIKINFRSMNKNKKNNILVNYDPNTEVVIESKTNFNNYYIFPIKTVKENSNVDSIGYIHQTNTLFIQYKSITKTIEGFELSLRPEPFGYFYHDVDKTVFDKLLKSKNKANYINKYIKTKYIYHKEPIGYNFI